MQHDGNSRVKPCCSDRRLAYKKAATKAPAPTRLPATAFIVAAAPVDCEPDPLRVALPLAPEPDPEAPDPEPVADGVGVALALKIMVVLLLAETVQVAVWFFPETGTSMVLTPGLTAGMDAGWPTEVSRAGWLVTWAGCPGMEEAAAG